MNLNIDGLELDGGRRLPFAEDFYTIQGEGRYTGCAAYFIRVAGCDVGCPWCDAQYTWNLRKFKVEEVDAVLARVAESGTPLAVITGGEPLIYPMGYLTERLHEMGVQVNLETSGSHAFSGRFDWVCLSPKRKKHPLEEAYDYANELKVVVESEADFEWAEENAAKVGKDCRLYLQVEWSVTDKMMPLIVDYVKAHPKWNISIQTHKYMQIP